MTAASGGTRWARGMFRAWVALSLIWLGLVSLIAFANLPRAESWTVNVAEDGRPIYLAEVLAAAEKAKAAGRGDLEAELHEASRERLFEFHERRAAAMKQWAAGALLPPIVLLAVGLLVGWVLKGFRSGAGA